MKTKLILSAIFSIALQVLVYAYAPVLSFLLSVCLICLFVWKRPKTTTKTEILMAAIVLAVAPIPSLIIPLVIMGAV